MPRRLIEVRGIVQGVGFRPFVHRLAVRHRLAGSVRNSGGNVIIEVEGNNPDLDQFTQALWLEAPPLARIHSVNCQTLAPTGQKEFLIEPSDIQEATSVFISPDVATCDDCLKELFDPQNRRFGYPFINCTNCGPRLTIVTGAPYDRLQTTMAEFPLCPACQAEYTDPDNRRYHAQPIACPDCGPQLALLDAKGKVLALSNPLQVFAEALREGRIGAVKGLGGFHLACDARNPKAVRSLRQRKARDEKPFAVMVSCIASAGRYCDISECEARLLTSPQAPIVLLRKKFPCEIVDLVAPRNPWLGLLLPYTPLHHLLMRAVGGSPLVMTSANKSDEPIIYRDEDLEKLCGIADLILTHNRRIHGRCDDSLMRVIDNVPLPVRRSRGYAPAPIPLPWECPQPILAVGGQLKSIFAIGRNSQAFLSHHLGDLDHPDARHSFIHDVSLYENLFDVRPRIIACDFHPDYASTRYAHERAQRQRLTLRPVQHHHAHMASCMAENQLNEFVIGVCWDGAGLGSDGTIWGGEFLVGDYLDFHRAAWFRPVPMPGGELASRQPWRMAATYLLDAGIDWDVLKERYPQCPFALITQIIHRRVNAPLTSSVGRLFDGIAALLGLRYTLSYEGQAAIELEALAGQRSPEHELPYSYVIIPSGERSDLGAFVIDTRPLIRDVARDLRAGLMPHAISQRFHVTLVDILLKTCRLIRERTNLNVVTLSGGVFLNAWLTQQACRQLSRDGFRVYRHRQVPPGDGGLSLGQLAVASAWLLKKQTE